MEQIILSLFKGYFGKRVIYLADEARWITGYGAPNVVKPGDYRRARVIIIAKEHYFETVRAFPFSAASEIRAAVELDPASYSPYSCGLFFFRVGERKGEQTTVNLWFVNNETAERLKSSHPVWLVPETALLAYSTPSPPLIYRTPGTRGVLFTHVAKERETVSCMYQNEDGAEASFRRGLGGNLSECPVEVIDTIDDYLMKLKKAFARLPAKALRPFAYKKLFSLTREAKGMLLWAASGALLIGLLYCALVALLLHDTKEKLTLKDRGLNVEVADIMRQADEIETIRQRRQAVYAIINSSSKTALLNILSETLPEDTVLSRIDLRGKLVEIWGDTPLASDLISLLDKNDAIYNVAFLSPLQKNNKNGKERFRIGFSYR